MAFISTGLAAKSTARGASITSTGATPSSAKSFPPGYKKDTKKTLGSARIVRTPLQWLIDRESLRCYKPPEPRRPYLRARMKTCGSLARRNDGRSQKFVPRPAGSLCFAKRRDAPADRHQNRAGPHAHQLRAPLRWAERPRQ